MKRLDLAGVRFGRLIVLEYLETNKGHAYWLCRCECGTENVRASSLVLRSGRTRSCGCLRKETSSAHCTSMTKHGHYKGNKPTPEYSAWLSMRQRCTRKAHKGYKDYGGRGITVCERWASFENFIEDMGTRPGTPERARSTFSLDRIDNAKGYEPGNCRWATSTEQNNNTRFNRRIELDGETKTLAAWTRELGITRGAFRRAAESRSDVEALRHLRERLRE